MGVLYRVLRPLQVGLAALIATAIMMIVWDCGVGG